MPTKILEFHGFAPLSPESIDYASRRWCPFIDQRCKKVQSGGACSLQAPTSPPVIICPNRLYANRFAVINRVADRTFGLDYKLINELEAERLRRDGLLEGNEVVVYGQGFSGEVGIDAPSEEDESGSFHIDYLLVAVDMDLKPHSIVAVEVQTIDTTNSYKEAAASYYQETEYSGYGGTRPGLTKAGFNWENVTKRILPQIIYKGHALRRERLATHGLFFILPDPVLRKILTRVGGSLLNYPKGPGTITFHSYQLATDWPDAERPLELMTEFTTTVEQIAFAFVSPRNLPPLGVYENALSGRLAKLRRSRKV